MPTVLLTYAWNDNERGDVDFIAQDLRDVGFHVRLFRWMPKPGNGLWEEVGDDLAIPGVVDGWLFHLTPNSLGSTLCREDFSRALDQLRRTRGADFPVVALAPSPAFLELAAADSRVEFTVCASERDWKDRVRTFVEGRPTPTTRKRVSPFDLHVARVERGDRFAFVIEIRPRAGSWTPFFAAVPLSERDGVRARLGFGPSGRAPAMPWAEEPGEGRLGEGPLWALWAKNAATPTESYYVFCDRLPSMIVFGVRGGQPQFEVAIDQTT